MRENRSDLTGAYQGQFVFITPAMVQSGLHLNGVRYRLFDAPTRAKIDRDLRWMLDDEKHPSKFGAPGGGDCEVKGQAAPPARLSWTSSQGQFGMASPASTGLAKR